MISAEMYVAILVWCALGVGSAAFYMYEESPFRTYPWWERILLFFWSPTLWPIVAYGAWIRNRTRRRGNQRHRKSGIPHCRRHGFILLKCRDRHKEYCAGCSAKNLCPQCGGTAFFSPRLCGRSNGGKPIVEYQHLYAEE